MEAKGWLAEQIDALNEKYEKYPQWLKTLMDIEMERFINKKDDE
jgi:hypothetical protein